MRSALMALACLPALVAASPAAASPAVDRLAARDRVMARAENRLAQRLTHERAALAATRARTDALQERYAASVAVVAARLRAAYAQPGISPLMAILAGDPAEAERRSLLTAALDRSDARMIRELRDALTDLHRAQAVRDRRAQALIAETRILAARHAAVRTRLARERRAEARARLAAGSSAGALVPALAGPTAPGVTARRGLPAAILAAHSLPGAAPVDARTGVAVSMDPPPAGPGLAVALPGQGVVTQPVTVAVPAGRRSFTGVVGIRGGDPPGRRTASGIPFTTGTLVAVHRTLPLGALVRLVRGPFEVVVRVVDRGPYVASRDMDISPAAAAQLHMDRRQLVRGEVLGAD